MLSEAERRAKRPCPRSRSIPALSTVPFREPPTPSVTPITANSPTSSHHNPHVPRPPLLLHLHHGKHIRHPLRRRERQPSQTFSSTSSITSRDSPRATTEPACSIGNPTTMSTKPSPRAAAQRMDPRQENRSDRPQESSLPRPGLRMVSVDGTRQRKSR